MQRINGVYQSKGGRVVVGAIVQVLLAGTNTPATLYEDKAGTTTVTELKTDNEGEYSFYVANGRYDIFMLVNGRRDGQQLDVLVYDPEDDLQEQDPDIPGLKIRVTALEEDVVGINADIAELRSDIGGALDNANGTREVWGIWAKDQVQPVSDLAEPDGAKMIGHGASTVGDELDAYATSTGSSKIGHIASGAGAVARTVQDRLRYVVDAADYIATPGASDAADKAGVQAAINYVNGLGGGRVRVRKPIRTVWNLSELTIPVGVLIDDERYSDSGHTAIHATGDDVELRIHGTSVTGGEGPSFTAVNNAATGDRTVSLVARYGNGAGDTVNQYLHFGWWDGAVWYADMDWLGKGADGFRSRLRLGAAGAVIVNPGGSGKNINPATAYAAGYSLIVNRAAQDGGGYQFGIKNGAIECPQEVHIQGANAALRFQNGSGSNRFSILSDFPSAGQLQIYDHIAGKAILTLTSDGTMALGANGITFTSTTAASVGTDTLFKDSADGKLKFKDGAGTINLLY